MSSQTGASLCKVSSSWTPFCNQIKEKCHHYGWTCRWRAGVNFVCHHFCVVIGSICEEESSEVNLDHCNYVAWQTEEIRISYWHKQNHIKTSRFASCSCFSDQILVCDAFIRTNHPAVARMLDFSSVCLYVCLSGMDMHCDHMVHFSVDLGLRLDSPMFWAPWHQSMSTYSQPSFSSSTWKIGREWMCKLGEALNANSDKYVVHRWN